MAVSGEGDAADPRGELTVDFGSTGNSGDYRRAGWASPELRHTWTIGHTSLLELPRPAIPTDYRLELEVGPFIWQDRLPEQRLVVLINGREIGRFAIKKVETIDCLIPWSLIAQNSQILVTFTHPDAARPVDVNRVPDHREIALAFETARLVRAAQGASGTPSSAEAKTELPVDQLMMQFESLGENCEFGLAQRRCGAEPLGLLRFASTPLSALLRAVKDRFEGLGEPDQIDVRMSDNGSEYLVLDRRYGILYHPWLLVGQAAPEEIRRREVNRLPLLKRKMIEDLEAGQKIFVYRGMQPLARVLVSRLFDVLRDYGPCTLLWVEVQDAAHPAGTVERLSDGLLKGYIDRFAPGENAHDLSLDGWITLCRRAHAMVRPTSAL